MTEFELRLWETFNSFTSMLNDVITRNKVSSAIAEVVANARPNNEYIVVCNSSNNSLEQIARNELWCHVTLWKRNNDMENYTLSIVP